MHVCIDVKHYEKRKINKTNKKITMETKKNNNKKQKKAKQITKGKKKPIIKKRLQIDFYLKAKHKVCYH